MTENETKETGQPQDGSRKNVHFMSERDSWNTPEPLLERIRGFLGGRISLDPCSNADSVVRAKTEWTVVEDGLSRSWRRFRNVFVNPPYGRGIIEPWTDKAIAEFRDSPRNEALLLLPARTDTAWFTRLRGAADAMCFIRGRLKFLGASSGAPFPSVIVYFGPRILEFASHFSEIGHVLLRSDIADLACNGWVYALPASTPEEDQ